MDFFFRNLSFLTIEEQKTLELTKHLFVSKLSFLKRQYRLAFEAIKEHELIVPEFSRSSRIAYDLNYKILSSLIHLSNSSEFEWMILNSLRVNDPRPYILGELPEKSVCLRIDWLCKNSSLFFFWLWKLGIISHNDWLHLSKLKQFQDSIGTGLINDYSYFASKKKDLIIAKPGLSNSLNKFIAWEEDFWRSLGRSINFSPFKQIFWPFLKSAQKTGNYKRVESAFSSNDYQYENIRKNKVFLKLPKDQLFQIEEAIAKLTSLDALVIAAEEFRFLNDPESFGLFKAIFLFFLEQRGLIFDPNQHAYLPRDPYLAFLDATKWLDMFLFLCENEVKVCLSINDLRKEHFEISCEIMLGILLNEKAVNHMLLVNTPNMSILIDICKKLKENLVYKNHYSSYLDKYLKFVYLE